MSDRFGGEVSGARVAGTEVIFVPEDTEVDNGGQIIKVHGGGVKVRAARVSSFPLPPVAFALLTWADAGQSLAAPLDLLQRRCQPVHRARQLR